MTLLKTIKTSLGEFSLKRKLKRFSRGREVRNIQDCRTVLVLGSYHDDENLEEITRLTSYLIGQGKEVFSLFYIGKSKEEIVSQLPAIKIVGLDHLSRLFIPRDPAIIELMNRDFDLLIDLSLKESFTLKYINALSNSKFKVGPALNYKRKFCDLTIEISNNESISYLITQIKHYLTQLKQEKHVA